MSSPFTRFAVNPTKIDRPRSVFDRPFSHKFDAPAGALIPFYCEEVMPGDSVVLKTNAFIRMKTQAVPVTDECWCDLAYFFIPYRLVWEHFKQFYGENDSPAWTEQNTYTIPCIGSTYAAAWIGENKTGLDRTHTLLDYLGAKIGLDDTAYNGTDTTYNAGLINTVKDISILPIRAYKLVHHVWYRDENYSAATGPTLGDTCDGSDLTVFYSVNGTTSYPVWKDGSFERVWALPDAFTTVLPGPQFGDAVRIPLGTGQIAVGPMGNTASDTDSVKNGATWVAPALFRKYAAVNGVNQATTSAGIGNLATDASGRLVGVTASPTSNGFLIPSNLWANLDVASSAVGATVNQIRNAFCLQRFYEAESRGGAHRYHTLIKAHFGIVNPDARVQIPEYLGGKRFMLNQDTVVSTANGTDTDGDSSYLGQIAGYSKTFDQVDGFAKSFTEFGVILGVCCFRPKKTYFQGTGPMWFRKKKLDFFSPEMAFLGEDKVPNKTVMLTGSHDEDVFGYQEFGYEYRYSPSRLSGSFRPNAQDNSLSNFTYASKLSYSATGEYTIAARQVNPETVSNSLVYTSDKYPFICDFHLSTKWTRPMPVYSIPGLVDHY